MNNFYLVYFCIAAATWCSHVLQCRKCLRQVVGNFTLLLEGVVIGLGWPVDAFQFVMVLIRKDHGLKLSDEIRIDGAISLTQKPGESDDEFHARMSQEIQAKIASFTKDKKEIP